jgi:hypothetical protein
MVQREGPPRLLAAVFILVAIIIAVLLFRIFQGFQRDRDDLMEAVSTNQPAAFFGAVQPLGLRLVKKEAALDVIVIKHLEKPLPN